MFNRGYPFLRLLVPALVAMGTCHHGLYTQVRLLKPSPHQILWITYINAPDNPSYPFLILIAPQTHRLNILPFLPSPNPFHNSPISYRSPTHPPPSPKTIEFADPKSPRCATCAVLVDNDAAAEMLPAPVLAVEEWHGLLRGPRRGGGGG